MPKENGAENPGRKKGSFREHLKKLLPKNLFGKSKTPNPIDDVQKEPERALKPFRIKIKEITINSQTSDVLLSCPPPNKPEAKIDINGSTVEEAEMKIEKFVREAWEEGLKTLKIITGETRLRDTAMKKVGQLKTILFAEAAPKGERLVVFPKWERIRKRGSEAIIVYLVSIKKPSFE